MQSTIDLQNHYHFNHTDVTSRLSLLVNAHFGTKIASLSLLLYPRDCCVKRLGAAGRRRARDIVTLTRRRSRATARQTRSPAKVGAILLQYTIAVHS